MTTDPNLNGVDDVPAATWARLAKVANRLKQAGEPDVTAEQIKQHYIDSIRQHLETHVTDERVTGPIGESAEPGARLGPWKFNIIDSIGVSVEASFDFTSLQDWDVTLTAYLTVAGKRLWKNTLTLSPEHSSIVLKPDIKAAKAELSISIEGDQLCLKVSGHGCYRWFGWHCSQPFQHQLFCFRSG
ncbi:hypothetical protein [Spongiactinospora sp. 9N601]|uniref:hypothetical protein n=1 Tax=Spongiactinospora sp. 9N601 TaxID=3375149 RepID=UPI0037B59BAE